MKPDRGLLDTGLADPYLRALDDTALALLDRNDQDGLLGTILARASALLGTPHAWIDLLDADGKRLVLRVGTGMFADLQGTSVGATVGLAGAIVRSGEPLVVEDYETWPDRANDLPVGLGVDARGAAEVGRSRRRRPRTRRREDCSPVAPSATSSPSRASLGSPRSGSRTRGSSTSPSRAPCTTTRPDCPTASC